MNFFSKLKKISLAGLMLGALPLVNAHAQDTLTVQTLTFDSITTRRGVWQFPDNPQDYRKIIMVNRLKCDPKTTHDQYNCGEWDYLTYMNVYKHTGKMDSSKYSLKTLRVGKALPDTIKIVNTPYSNTYTDRQYSKSLVSTQSETAYPVIPNTTEITMGQTGRIQFLLHKDTLLNKGLKAGQFNRIQLPIKVGNGNKLFVKLSMKAVSNKSLSSFDESAFTTAYTGYIDAPANGLLTINFNEPLAWDAKNSLKFEFCYSVIGDNGSVVIGGSNEMQAAYASTDNVVLKLDGNGDWVDCGATPELSGTDKVTYEAWVNVDKWKNWAELVGKGEHICIQLGDKEGTLYCILRDGKTNTYGYVGGCITPGTWAHVAMVYDGTKATNDEKLKLYINGELRPLTFNGNIPSTGPITSSPLAISTIEYDGGNFSGNIDEVRVWKAALDVVTINTYLSTPIDNKHANFSDLIANYSIKSINNHQIANSVNGGANGQLLGNITTAKPNPVGLTVNSKLMNFIPAATLLAGNYTMKNDSTEYTYSVEVAPSSIETLDLVNLIPVRTDLKYAYLSDTARVYDAFGKVVSSTFIPADEQKLNSVVSKYSEPFERIEQYEIGRYITPYGKGLDLGPDGFAWHYDVTDYAPLLKGMVDLAAGNQQELIDLKFLFIKGESPRDVVEITPVWASYNENSTKQGMAISKPVFVANRDITYDKLSNDKELSAKNITVNPLAKSFKVKTRFTGHGHQSNNMEYPHCCEWKDNTHSILANKTTVGSWHIFTDECAENPVYPQGGTWPGSREGWCPGDLVKEYEFDVSPYIIAGKLNLDYDITKIPQDNLGMGNGNYIAAVDLIQYSDLKHDNDAEVYDIIAPNDFPYYSRKNPICSNPTVVIRNNGKTDLESLTFKYSVSGGSEEIYNWKGSIISTESQSIVLPLSSSLFWVGDTEHRFTVTVSNPNGTTDENSTNNVGTTTFNKPDIFKKSIIIVTTTNNRGAGQGYSYYVSDWLGNKKINRASLKAKTVYRDTLTYSQGCYTFSFTDEYNYGLEYWAYPDQGSGSIKITDLQGNVLKIFDPDFGHGIKYSFDMADFTSIEDDGSNFSVTAFPNPSTDVLNINTGLLSGAANCRINDLNGAVMMTKAVEINPNSVISLDIAKFAKGMYMLAIELGDRTIYRKFIKK